MTKPTADRVMVQPTAAAPSGSANAVKFVPFASRAPAPPAPLAQPRPNTGGPRVRGDAPVVLFPVRIETRFASGPAGPELWVRVYPDQIEVDGHKPDLSAGERIAGDAYWAAVWNQLQSATGDPRGPWRSLASRYGNTRAAWISLQTWPSNWPPGFPSPPSAVWPAPVPAAAAPLATTPTPTQVSPTPMARLMPYQWSVYLYDSGGGPPGAFLFNSPVQPNLLVGPDLSAAAQLGALDSGGMRWMIDFDEAVRVGMAARVPLSPSQASNGLTRLVVLGLVDPGQETPKDLLERLLGAHRFTDGLALVPRGAPTKNTDSGPSAVLRQDVGYGNGYAAEQGAPLLPSAGSGPPTMDGQLLASYLGIDPATLAHVQGADGTDQRDATDMARVLWPSTLGYLLRHLVNGTSAQIASYQQHYVNYVVGRGPIPPIRIGDVPYGILPVTSLATWKRPTVSPVVSKMVPLLRLASAYWLSAALANTPYVGKTNDPDNDLLQILGMNPSPVAYTARWALGPDFVWNSMQWFGVPGSSAKSTDDLLDKPFVDFLLALGGLSLPATPPRLMGLGFQPNEFQVTPPTVQDDPSLPLSESAYLKRNIPPVTGSTMGRNYLDWLGSAVLTDIQAENYPVSPVPPSLLYKFVREAVLNVAADKAADAAVATATPINGVVLTAADLPEKEFVHLGTPTPIPSRWEILSARIPGIPRISQPISNFLDPGYVSSLANLALLSTAELDRLLGETLDTMSTRLDAWITSVATAGLLDTEGNPIPPAAIGCYGWVEKVAPAEKVSDQLTATERRAVAGLDKKILPARTAVLNPVDPPSSDNGGFIHAPSLAQATTAAILRESYLTHRQASNGAQLAIDLSSQRVRMALRILSAIRDGELFGAVLGAMFEENLQAGSATAAYIPAFRALYPLKANKLGQTNPPPDPSQAAAPSVVDGAALQLAWSTGGIQWGTGGLPNDAGSGPGSVRTALDDLNGIMDALGDVSLAESVFQILRGNPGRAGGILDTIQQGQTPPEVQVFSTPRSGKTVTNRILIVGPGDAPQPSWNMGSTRPRARAEPWLHSWLTSMLPAPSKAICRVTYVTGLPVPPKLPSINVSLDKLDVGPLDMTTFLSSTDTARMAELEQRVLYYAAFDPSSPLPAGAQDLAVDFDLDSTAPAGSITFPQYMLLVKAARDLVGGCRPLAPSDLVVPVAGATTDDEAAADATSLGGLASAATDQLQLADTHLRTSASSLLDALLDPAAGTSAALVDALTIAMFEASWFGIPGSISPPPGSPSPSVATAAITSKSSSAVPPVPTFLVQFPLGPSDQVAGGTDTVTLWGPAGTSFPSGAGAYTINGAPVATAPVLGANSVQVTFPSDISPLSQVSMTIVNVKFPAGVSPSVGLATKGTVLGVPNDPILESADLLDRARRLDVAIKGRLAGIPGPLAGATLTVTPAIGGAIAELDIRFTTSSNGLLHAKAGTVTVLAPLGTTFPSDPRKYTVAVGGSQSNVIAVPTVSGSVVVLTVPQDVPAGATATLTIEGVTTPGAGTYGLSMRTSADSVAVPLGQVTLSGGAPQNAVTSLSVPKSSPQAGFKIVFSTSATGALAKGAGTITLVGPSGLKFSSQAADYTTAGNALTSAPLVGDGMVVLSVPQDIRASTQVTVTAQSASGLGAGAYSLSVSTSADRALTAAPFTIPARVSDLISNLRAVFGRSFVVLPHYTPTSTAEFALGLGDSASVFGADPTVPETWFQQVVQVRPGTSRLDLLFGLATVAAGPPQPSFAVSQLPYRPHDVWLGGKQPPQLTAVTVSVSPTDGGGRALYTIRFTTSNQGQLPLGGTITVAAPPGTVWPPSPTAYQVQALAGGLATVQSVTRSAVMGSSTNNQVAISFDGAAVGPGDTVAIQVAGVQNPIGPGDGCTLVVYTSADTAGVTSTPFSITASSGQASPAPPTRDRVALVCVGWPGFQASAALAAAGAIAGLVVDEWSERIPDPQETTGLVFHHDEPWSQAPQAILLAVNPVMNETWGGEDPLDTLRTVIEETIDLSKIRTVDLAGLGVWGEIIPALYVPYNYNNDTISTLVYNPSTLVYLGLTGGATA